MASKTINYNTPIYLWLSIINAPYIGLKKSIDQSNLNVINKLNGITTLSKTNTRQNKRYYNMTFKVSGKKMAQNNREQ